jgi:ABC-type transport system involved in cytochrome c biogenesis permease subunit
MCHWTFPKPRQLPCKAVSVPLQKLAPSQPAAPLMAKRGIIHRDAKTVGVSSLSHPMWILYYARLARLQTPLMTARNWTELIFLDKVIAFAAGHKQFGYGRRQAYRAFVAT